MKRISTILSVIILLAVAIAVQSCGDTQTKKGSSEHDSDSVHVVLIDTIDVPGIYDVVGVVGEGTSMNVLELLTDDGDTLTIECPNDMVTGGVGIGERLAVTYNAGDEGNYAMMSINLTALQHLWTQLGLDGQEQSLELDEGGRAITYNMNVEYSSWSLEDGKLLLHTPHKIASETAAVADTFEIMELSDESLVLMHGNLASEFRCDN